MLRKPSQTIEKRISSIERITIALVSMQIQEKRIDIICKTENTKNYSF